MPVVMSMQWDNVTPEQYEKALEALDLDADPPAGGMFHLAGFESDSIRVVDVWESPDDFQAFAEGRLAEASAAAGMTGEPTVVVYEVHNVWTPEGATFERLAGA